MIKKEELINLLTPSRFVTNKGVSNNVVSFLGNKLVSFAVRRVRLKREGTR
ncbi:MAG: hypothetical protein KAW12_14205 [Candidatus Aminicenantes bacterium]|nr:hypothetical protein [Candidatus Aminicenantes bacterium]